MRLHNLTLSGFRRFADASANLNDNVIALVGPNEAGKSSVLAALKALEHDDPIAVTSRTRNRSVPDSQEIIVARFRMEDGDLEAPPYPFADNAAKWLIVAKTAGGARHFRFAPSPVRPLAPRIAGKRSVDVALDAAVQAHIPKPLRPIVGELRTLLDTDAQALSGDAKSKLTSVVSELRKHLKLPTTSETSVKALQPLFATLATALDHEKLPSPDEYARTIGLESMPEFVEFDDDSRTLKSEYPFAGDGSAAFRNFCALAGLNTGALRRAHQAGDSAQITEIFEKAVERLADKLAVEWSQATRLKVGFDREQAVLKLNVKSQGGAYQALGERSDGLRTFIALRAFLAQRTSDRPVVLLIDEAETHLHYDAQADLVRVLELQRDAQQVIYTTHSIGCLPQDLGRGVRAVVPDHETHQSTLDEAWMRSRSGVAPLMAAIGAATVPLTPSRHIIIAEGPSDALLLPSLIREVGRYRALPFQIVSGFAEASEAELRRLAAETQHVGFLADGDDGGNDRIRFALNSGVPKGRLAQYEVGLCLEDLIDADLYLRAVNSCFEAWNKPARMSAADVPATGRPAAVRAWCRANGIKEDGKIDVAQEVLRLYQADASSNRRLSDRAKRKAIADLYKRMLRALRISREDAEAFSRPA